MNLLRKSRPTLADELARKSFTSRDAAEMGAVELSADLPPERVVALIRQILKSRDDMSEIHYRQIAADAGRAETDLARKDWPLREMME